MADERNDHSLQTVCHQGDKHRCWVEEEISQERANPSHHKGRHRIQQDCCDIDDCIAEVQVPAGHGYGKDAQTQDDCHGHKQPRHRQAKRLISCHCTVHNEYLLLGI